MDEIGKRGVGEREAGRRKVEEEQRLGGGAPKSQKAGVTMSMVLVVGGLATFP